METNIGNLTRTDMTAKVQDYSVPNMQTDAATGQSEFFWDFPDFTKYLGYYKQIPELKKAIDALATWTIGKDYTTDDVTKVNLEHVHGNGKETFLSIMWSLFVMKKFNGDAFAEIIRNQDNADFVNLKILDPSTMRVVQDPKGLIKRYEQRSKVGKKGEMKKFKPYQILHLINDKAADEIHGTSVIEACKWVIDARNEAMSDWRRISHRSTIRVMYVDADNTTKLSTIKSEYADAINKGELLIVPAKRGEAEIEDITLPPVANFLEWIRYLENFFYQAVGVPRVIATSENFTEASSKIGYLTFEPIYSREQILLEKELWNQLGIKIKFNRPPSLMPNAQVDEAKNTGQLGFQANDVTAGRGAESAV